MSDGFELDAEGQVVAGGSIPVKRTNIALKLKATSGPEHSAPDISVNSSKKRKSRLKSDGYPQLADDQDLIWDQRLLLLGDKIDQPNLHICEHCCLPILVYGRLKRCKHSFCFTCMLNCQGKCPRCGEANQEHERGELGSVHICSYGGSRHGHSGCRRSYLSQRDLQAHIRYRHEGGQEKATALQQQQQQQQHTSASGIRAGMFPPSIVPPPPPAPRLPAYPIALPPDLPPPAAPPFFPPGVKSHYASSMDAQGSVFRAAAPSIPPPPRPAVPRPPRPPSMPFHPSASSVSVPPPSMLPQPSSGPKPFVAFEARTSYQ